MPKTERRPPPRHVRAGGPRRGLALARRGVEHAAQPLLRPPCRGDGPARCTEVQARGIPRAVSKSAYTCAWLPTGRTLSFEVSAGLGTSGLGALGFPRSGLVFSLTD